MKMKKFHKIFLCLLISAGISVFNIISASAVLETMFQTDEDIEQEERDKETREHHITELKSRELPAIEKPILPQTEQTMREKKDELCKQYEKIMRMDQSQIYALRIWKTKVFSCLKKLSAQSNGGTSDISHKDIMIFLLEIISATTHYTPSIPHYTDYIIRFDPERGLSGSIVCFSPSNPYYIFAEL